METHSTLKGTAEQMITLFNQNDGVVSVRYYEKTKKDTYKVILRHPEDFNLDGTNHEILKVIEKSRMAYKRS